jgi:hypothetical protein
MPARPSYYIRLPEGIAALRSLPADWVDRRQVEEALGISKTVAWRLLRKCGVEPGPGGAMITHRDELIGRLEALARDGGPVEQEIGRRARLETFLERIRPTVVASLTRIADDRDALALINSRFAKLPENVALTPTSLHIDFSGTEDFLRAIGAVVYALQNDYESIRDFIDAGHTGAPVRPALGV